MVGISTEYTYDVADREYDVADREEADGGEVLKKRVVVGGGVVHGQPLVAGLGVAGLYGVVGVSRGW